MQRLLFAKHLLVVAIVLLLSLGALPAFGQSAPVAADTAAQTANAPQTPAAQAEQMRTLLLRAQLDLGADGAAGSAAIAEANALYAATLGVQLAASAPQAHARVRAAFAAAAEAAAAGDAVALAGARAAAWTALLDGAYQSTRAAILANDAQLAAQWLPVREFRQATRFSRPNGDASVALANLHAGSIAPDEALRVLNADLLDTYQARLNDALRALTEADAQGFALRRAELASGAAGYFAMLAPAYAEQRGVEAATAAQAAFAALAADGRAGRALAPQLEPLQAKLAGFRAAPLAPREQARRAGQMVRFLELVPVEYGRAIRDGKVVSTLELREAITFHEGASAAFADLRNELEAQAPQATQSMQAQYDLMGAQLSAATRGGEVVAPALMRTQTEALLQALRSAMPAAWQRQDSSADFDVINTALAQMMQAATEGNMAVADSARLEAYAILESGPEARLFSFAPQTIPVLEGLFWYGYEQTPGLAGLIEEGASVEEIRATGILLEAKLLEAQEALSGASDPTAVALNAAVIVFREGLEAVVILAALLASMVGARKVLRRPMAMGVALAFVASGVTWWLMQTILSQFRAYGERLEAVVSIIAIAVLLLITNWFFHKVYWKEWMAGLHTRKKSLMGGVVVGQSLGFVLLGFTSVYREGFETVLFMQALVLSGGVWATLEGVALGMAGVVAVGFITFKFQSRLPYKQMLVWTGVLIGAVLLVMVGNTVHVLQLVGWMPIHPVRWLSLPYWAGMWFGLYPTWEGFAMQGVAALFVIGSYFLAEIVQRKQLAATPRPVRPAKAEMPRVLEEA